VLDLDGTVIQMVPEALRAWHAGLSVWQGVTDINSCSIGIEIQNVGHSAGYPDFPDIQMRALEALCRDICARNTIRPERVLAHSDIAPSRKHDPGEKFDWKRLARAGVGHWVAPVAPDPADAGVGRQSTARQVGEMQALLAAYGYGVPQTGCLDGATEQVVIAFQRHFRPARVDGRIDASCLGTIDRLIAALPTSRVA
jgi:N-acetylmuramoyl-L-alanine amidase